MYQTTTLYTSQLKFHNKSIMMSKIGNTFFHQHNLCPSIPRVNEYTNLYSVWVAYLPSERMNINFKTPSIGSFSKFNPYQSIYLQCTNREYYEYIDRPIHYITRYIPSIKWRHFLRIYTYKILPSYYTG